MAAKKKKLKNLINFMNKPTMSQMALEFLNIISKNNSFTKC